MDDDHVTRTVHDMAMCFHSSRTQLELCYLVEAYLVCMPGLQLLSASLCSSDCWHYALLSSFSFFGLGVDSTACGVATFFINQSLVLCLLHGGFSLVLWFSAIFFSPFLYLLSSFVGKAFSLRGVNVRIAIHYIAIILCFIGFLSFILLFMSFLYAHFMLW